MSEKVSVLNISVKMLPSGKISWLSKSCIFALQSIVRLTRVHTSVSLLLAYLQGQEELCGPFSGQRCRSHSGRQCYSRGIQ